MKNKTETNDIFVIFLLSEFYVSFLFFLFDCLFFFFYFLFLYVFRVLDFFLSIFTHQKSKTRKKLNVKTECVYFVLFFYFKL